MRIYTTKVTLRKALDTLSKENTIGFVPTMGVLHTGHLSLVKKAKEIADIVVVSIFVNPTQFNNKEDLEKYPSTLEEDLRILEREGCEVVFVPSVKEMYSENIASLSFDFGDLDTVMEGAFRKGHFDGVGTIVKRLFEIVQPDFAFFGEKDFQQLQIIKRMVVKEKFPIKIISVPIFREPDGLAMSSRNRRLSKEYREAAPFIYKTLQEAKRLFGIENAITVMEWVKNEFKNHPLLKLEYFTIAEEISLQPIQNQKSTQKYRAFIAVFADKIRLIDNIALY